MAAAAVWACAFAAGNDSQPYQSEKVTFANGDVYVGYTYSALGGDSVAFATEFAIVSLKADEAAELFDLDNIVKRRFSALDNLWLKFKMHYPDEMVEYLDPSRVGDPVLSFAAARSYDGRYGPDVAILSRDNEKVRVLSVAPKRNIFAYKDIRSIERKIVPFNARVGLRDVYTLNNGDVVCGGVLEDVPGSHVNIITLDGEKKRISESEYCRVEVQVIDTLQGIVSQSPYISKFTFRGEAPIEGVLKSIDYNAGTMTVATLSGPAEVVRGLDKYVSRTTRRNEAYPPKPVEPLDYSAAQVYLNRTVMAPNEYSKRDFTVVRQTLFQSTVTVDAGQPFKISYKADSYKDMPFLSKFEFSSVETVGDTRDQVADVKRDNAMAGALMYRSYSETDGIVTLSYDNVASGQYVFFFGINSPVYFVSVRNVIPTKK